MKIITLILFMLCLMATITCSDTSEENTKPIFEVEICKVLKTKYTEWVSLNYFGDFEVVRYFLYSDGYLEEVDIKTYMEFTEGDTICWKEHY